MKKAPALVVCFVICLSLAACGERAPEAESAVSSAAGGASSVQSAASAGGEAMTLEAYVDSIRDQLESTAGILEGIGLRVTARGDSLVYSYQYTEEVEVTDELKSALADALDGMSSAFAALLSSVRQAVPSADSILVEYLDKNGELIASKEFR